ncbi:MAG: SAM-dependent methyltransferase [Parabacteroides merdae]
MRKEAHWENKGQTKDFTYAIAISKSAIQDEEIVSKKGNEDMDIPEIVRAGPSDPELISIRGRRMLENADLILYAGSLVPKELTLCAKKGSTIRSSADMNLEEQFAHIKKFYDKGSSSYGLHTGDPLHLWGDTRTDGILRPLWHELPYYTGNLLVPSCCCSSPFPVHYS